MDRPARHPPFPRAPLIGAAALIALVIALAIAGRMGAAFDDRPTAAAVMSRDLLFQDRADGAVVVMDARDPAVPIAVMAPGTNGFLRATLRGLARVRLRENEGQTTPFRFTEWADGRLTLEDLATGRWVEMEAFGITNETVFARLLTAKGASS